MEDIIDGLVLEGVHETKCMNTLQFSTNINAPKETIWKTLWEDSTFRQWANLIDEGTYLKGTLKEGNEIEFLSSVNGYGVTSLVETFTPNAFALFRHKTDTQDSGAKERDKEWTGTSESYLLTEQNGTTTLTVKTDVPDEQLETFNVRLPKALACIKNLAERK